MLLLQNWGAGGRRQEVQPRPDPVGKWRLLRVTTKLTGAPLRFPGTAETRSVKLRLTLLVFCVKCCEVMEKNLSAKIPLPTW